MQQGLTSCRSSPVGAYPEIRELLDAETEGDDATRHLENTRVVVQAEVGVRGGKHPAQSEGEPIGIVIGSELMMSLRGGRELTDQCGEAILESRHPFLDRARTRFGSPSSPTSSPRVTETTS